LKFPRDKVFTLGMITMQTIQELQEFEVEKFYRSGKQSVFTQSCLYKNASD
jgi:hypothetical protein